MDPPTRLHLLVRVIDGVRSYQPNCFPEEFMKEQDKIINEMLGIQQSEGKAFFQQWGERVSESQVTVDEIQQYLGSDELEKNESKVCKSSGILVKMTFQSPKIRKILQLNDLRLTKRFFYNYQLSTIDSVFAFFKEEQHLVWYQRDPKAARVSWRDDARYKPFVFKSEDEMKNDNESYSKWLKEIEQDTGFTKQPGNVLLQPELFLERKEFKEKVLHILEKNANAESKKAYSYLKIMSGAGCGKTTASWQIQNFANVEFFWMDCSFLNGGTAFKKLLNTCDLNEEQLFKVVMIFAILNLAHNSSNYEKFFASISRNSFFKMTEQILADIVKKKIPSDKKNTVVLVVDEFQKIHEIVNDFDYVFLKTICNFFYMCRKSFSGLLAVCGTFSAGLAENYNLTFFDEEDMAHFLTPLSPLATLQKFELLVNNPFKFFGWLNPRHNDNDQTVKERKEDIECLMNILSHPRAFEEIKAIKLGDSFTECVQIIKNLTIEKCGFATIQNEEDTKQFKTLALSLVLFPSKSSTLINNGFFKKMRERGYVFVEKLANESFFGLSSPLFYELMQEYGLNHFHFEENEAKKGKEKKEDHPEYFLDKEKIEKFCNEFSCAVVKQLQAENKSDTFEFDLNCVFPKFKRINPQALTSQNDLDAFLKDSDPTKLVQMFTPDDKVMLPEGMTLKNQKFDTKFIGNNHSIIMQPSKLHDPKTSTVFNLYPDSHTFLDRLIILKNQKLNQPGEKSIFFGKSPKEYIHFQIQDKSGANGSEDRDSVAWAFKSGAKKLKKGQFMLGNMIELYEKTEFYCCVIHNNPNVVSNASAIQNSLKDWLKPFKNDKKKWNEVINALKHLLWIDSECYLNGFCPNICRMLQCCNVENSDPKRAIFLQFPRVNGSHVFKYHTGIVKDTNKDENVRFVEINTKESRFFLDRDMIIHCEEKTEGYTKIKEFLSKKKIYVWEEKSICNQIQKKSAVLNHAGKQVQGIVTKCEVPVMSGLILLTVEVEEITLELLYNPLANKILGTKDGKKEWTGNLDKKVAKKKEVNGSGKLASQEQSSGTIDLQMIFNEIRSLNSKFEAMERKTDKRLEVLEKKVMQE